MPKNWPTPAYIKYIHRVIEHNTLDSENTTLATFISKDLPEILEFSQYVKTSILNGLVQLSYSDIWYMYDTHSTIDYFTLAVKKPDVLEEVAAILAIQNYDQQESFRQKINARLDFTQFLKNNAQEFIASLSENNKDVSYVYNEEKNSINPEKFGTFALNWAVNASDQEKEDMKESIAKKKQ